MAELKRDFTPADLLGLLKKCNVNGTIAVQADQTEDETSFLLDLAKQNDFIKGVVGWADLTHPAIDEKLHRYSKVSNLCGFRHQIQDEDDPQFALRKDFQHGLGLLSKYGFTYDVLIYPRQMDAALKMIDSFPDQPFIIDHMAKPRIGLGTTPGWADFISYLGRNTDTYCKVSGMVTEARWKGWTYEDLKPYLDVVFENFRLDRIVFGSDWPVCLLAADYREVIEVVDRYIDQFDNSERALIMGANGLRFYQVN